MSKVVKSVGRAIGGVVKGVTKVVKGVVSGVSKVFKSIASSKLGKVLLVAAGAYFALPAIAGALGGASAGAAAGSGFFGTIGSTLSGAGSGAMAGLSQAWSGITGAASALGSGSLSGAGSALVGGVSPSAAFAAGQGTMTAATGALGATNAAASLAGNPMTATNAALADSAVGTAGYGTSSALPGATLSTGASSPGLISGAWNAMGDRAQAATIQAATSVGGNLISGYGQQKAAEEQRNYEQQQADAARARYNENVGTNWWPASSQGTFDANMSSMGAAPAQTNAPAGLVANSMAQQNYREYMDNLMRSYNPYQLRTA